MSTLMSSVEEDLRYYSCVGDEEGVKNLISMNVDVNSRNSMNGWTALHWAVHRNHTRIVEILLENGAKPEIRNDRLQKPCHLATSSVIRGMLGESDTRNEMIMQLPIKPSYLKHPTLPMYNNSQKHGECKQRNKGNLKDDYENKNITSEIILKVRIAGAEDLDFNEILLNKKELSVEKLIDVCCSELNFDKSNILKIRKLPNTVIRKDNEVERLENYQEIEFVLSYNY